MNNDLLLSFREHNLMTNESIGIFTHKSFRIISYILWSDPSKVPVRFQGRKAVLCLPCLHLQSKFQLFWNYTITKLSVKKAQLTGWWARNCATIYSTGFDFKNCLRARKVPGRGLSRNVPRGRFFFPSFSPIMNPNKTAQFEGQSTCPFLSLTLSNFIQGEEN